MRAIDFERARIGWTTRDGSRGSWRVVAAARREDGGDAWFLAAGVMAGDVYGKGRLPLHPAYSFHFAASRDWHVMFRDAVDAAGLQDTVAPNSDSFSSLGIEVPEFDAAALPPEAVRDRWPLAARIVAAAADGVRWTLEFPLNHLNVRDDASAWQVETGPIVVPCELIDIAGAAKAGGLQRAFVFFNRLDRADLLAFGPFGECRRGFAHAARLGGAEITLLA